MIKKLLLLGVSTALSVLALETLVRLRFADELDPELLRERARQAVISEITRASDHPELVYELRPGLDITWRNTRVVTHDTEPRRIAPGQPSDTDAELRIALIGDSTPFGWRVQYQHTYGERLRAALEVSSGKRVALRNYSVPGYNSHHLRIVYRDRVRAWKPHLLVLHYDHNDADPIDEKPHGHMEPELGDNLLHSALIKLVIRRAYQRKVESMRPAGDDGKRVFRYYRYAGAQYDRHLGELTQLAELASKEDTPVLALVFNTWLARTEDAGSDPYHTLLHARLIPKLEALGMLAVDTYGPSQDLMKERGWSSMQPIWVAPGDGHPGPVGHQYLADLLHAEITQRLPELAN